MVTSSRSKTVQADGHELALVVVLIVPTDIIQAFLCCLVESYIISMAIVT